MKKIFALLMAVVMCLSFAACGEGEKEEEKNKVELTAQNIKDYLSFNAKVEECEFYEGYGFSGGYFGAQGAATVLLESTNTSGAKFKNVSITLEVYTKGGLNCGWEFTSDNNRCDEEHKREYNYKEITIDLSSDGKWSTTELLEWENYKGEWSENAAIYDELSDSDIEFKIIEVSGTVTVDE